MTLQEARIQFHKEYKELNNLKLIIEKLKKQRDKFTKDSPVVPKDLTLSILKNEILLANKQELIEIINEFIRRQEELLLGE